MSIKPPTALNPPASLRVARAPNATTLYGDGRYYLMIKTEPHREWELPAGWRWDSLVAAQRGAKEAAHQWMAVRLMDGATGLQVSIP